MSLSMPMVPVSVGPVPAVAVVRPVIIIRDGHAQQSARNSADQRAGSAAVAVDGSAARGVSLQCWHISDGMIGSGERAEAQAGRSGKKTGFYHIRQTPWRLC
jgi:hypothetical protein